jgi:hypothetical protein
MFRFVLASVVALAVVACSKADQSESAPASTGRVPVIPDTLLAQIGDSSTMVIAVDLAHMNTKPLVEQIPDDPPCMREIVRTAGTVVIATGSEYVGRVTGIDREVAQTCASVFGKQLGFAIKPSTNGFDFDIPGQPITATWDRGIATIGQRGHTPPKGAPRAEIAALLAKVPRSAKGLIAQVDEPTKRIKSLVGWLETTDDTFILTLRFEGTKDGNAHTACTEVISGFKKGAAEKGLKIEDKWFQIRDDGIVSTVVATVPFDFIKR